MKTNTKKNNEDHEDHEDDSNAYVISFVVNLLQSVLFIYSSEQDGSA